MKTNDIETARQYCEPLNIYISGEVASIEINELYKLLTDYATYLTAPDSDGAKSAEEMRVEFYGENDARSYDQYEIDLMKAFAAQLRKEVSDEEIIKEAGNIIAWKHRGIIIDYFTLGAKWARSKMQNKTA